MQSCLHKVLFFFLVTLSASVNAQTNNAKNILAKWNVEKVELLNKLRDTSKVHELDGVSLKFDNDSLIISKTTNGIERYIKSGTYYLSQDGLGLFIGNDRADIVALNDQRLVVMVKDEYIMYLSKN